jgi:HD-GYP domain-containing protein (c-di-GMP phosphodiesterase class II)
MSVLEEFLQFIEYPRRQPVQQLLRRVLLKSRELTGAEAGSIFIVRGRGSHRRLEAASVQNDVIRLKPADIVVPITTSSIAGFVAVTGETVFVDDLYAIPEGRPYRFDPSFDHQHAYRSRTMLAFPLTNYDRKVIGVVQLINRRPTASSDPQPFKRKQADLIMPFNHIVGSVIERTDMLERISEQNKRLRERNRQLREQQERIAALQNETEEAFQLSINLLARAAELHDEGTSEHVKRVNEYSYFLASALGQPAPFCNEIRYSAQLHDVGKMSVDVAILRKQGRLDPNEMDEMRMHPVYGHQILSASDRLRMAAEIALSHHECWDGTGYPDGLSGEQIPLSARIVSVADVYDALRSERPYKKGFSHERACEIVLEGDDRTHPSSFDPMVLRTFADNHEGMAAIWNELRDPVEGVA